MRLIPAVSIMSGRVTIVEDGQYRHLRTEDGRFKNPSNVLKEQESDVVFILDIDGIEKNTPDLNLITRLSDLKELWVDAAPLTTGGAADILISGAERAVMGTKAMLDMNHLAEAVELSENIIFSLDYDNGTLAANKKMGSMDIDELLAEVKEIGVERAMLFDLGGNRDNVPPDTDIMRKIAEGFDESFVAGHIRQDNIEHYENIGLTGVIVDFRTLRGLSR